MASRVRNLAEPGSLLKRPFSPRRKYTIYEGQGKTKDGRKPYRPNVTVKRKRTSRRLKDEAYKRDIRQCYCVACGNRGVTPDKQATGYGNDAAHVRFSDAANGNVNPGLGGRNDDWKVVPLCSWQTPNKCHMAQHGAFEQIGEREFWLERVGYNPYPLCRKLRKAWPDLQKMMEITFKYALKSKWRPRQCKGTTENASRLGASGKELLKSLRPDGSV